MWKLTTVVVLALAAGTTGANAEKKVSITVAEAKKICQSNDASPSCGLCLDRQCDHGYHVSCEGTKCTKETWVRTPSKKLPTVGKMPDGGILDTGPSAGGNSPAAAGASAPSAPRGPTLR